MGAVLAASCGSRTGLPAGENDSGAGDDSPPARFLVLGGDDRYGPAEVSRDGHLSVEQPQHGPFASKLVGSAAFPLILGGEAGIRGPIVDVVDPQTGAPTRRLQLGGVLDGCMLSPDLLCMVGGAGELRFALIDLPTSTVLATLDAERPGTEARSGLVPFAQGCLVAGERLYVAIGLVAPEGQDFSLQRAEWLAALDTRTDEFVDLAPEDPDSEVVTLGGRTAKPRLDPISGRLYWVEFVDAPLLWISSFDPATSSVARHVVGFDALDGGSVFTMEMIAGNQGLLALNTGRPGAGGPRMALIQFDATRGESWVVREYEDEYFWDVAAAFGRWAIIAGGHCIEVVDLATGELGPAGRLDLDSPGGAMFLGALED